MKWFSCASDRVAHFCGSVWAVLGALGLTLGWLACGPVFSFSDTWQLWMNTITTVITFLMVFVIQATQNRDTAATHAKLDELIRSSAAKNEFIEADLKTEEEIKEMRERS